MQIKNLDFQEIFPNQELEVVEGGDRSFQISYAWNMQFDDPLAILKRQFGLVCAPSPEGGEDTSTMSPGWPWY